MSHLIIFFSVYFSYSVSFVPPFVLIRAAYVEKAVQAFDICDDVQMRVLREWCPLSDPNPIHLEQGRLLATDTKPQGSSAL